MHENAGYGAEGCTDEPQRLHADDTKGCTSVQPDLGTPTSLLLRRSGGRAAARGGPASPGADDRPAFFDPTSDTKATSWLDASLYGFDAGEETQIDAMLGQGYHPHAIYNTIMKQRGA